MNIDWQPLKQIIAAEHSYLLTSHCRADCDALGSELAMAAILRSLGKEVRIVNGDSVPRHISFMDPQRQIEVLGEHVQPAELKNFDVLIIVDTSAWGQLGLMGKVVREFAGRRVVIDHHISQDDMLATVFKDSTAEATGRLILELAEYLEVEIVPDTASSLFAAIATDTGWFRFASVTEETFRALARLVGAGASPPALFSALYEQHTLARLYLRARILSNIQPHLDGRLMSTFVTRQDFEETAADQTDTEDVINSLLTIAGSEVAVMFVELKDMLTKVSLRSRSDFDVRAIAEQHGGGGHAAAAGIAFPDGLASAQTTILDTLRKAMG